MNLDQIAQSFLAEAQDILEELEQELLELDSGATPDQIDAVFRALHTIKGSAAMFGFVELAGFAHHFETAFEDVRVGRRQVSTSLVDAALSARDLLQKFLAVPPETPEAIALAKGDEAKGIIDRLYEDAPEGRAPKPKNSQSDAMQSTDASDDLAAWIVTFVPHIDDLRNGSRPDLLVSELLELGQALVALDPQRVPDLTELEPSDACLAWEITYQEPVSKQAVQDVFVFNEEAEVTIVSPEDKAQQMDVQTEQPTAANAQDSKISDSIEKAHSTAQKSDFLRVPATRVDQIMDDLGELVIAQSRLSQMVDGHADPNLDAAVEDVERLVHALRDSALSMRMLPVESVFGRFRRVVRDLSSSLGKSVELVTLGGETEVDKNVLDRLTDPLVHMLRNALDHGLESSDERIAAGKPAEGKVFLAAKQEGGEVILQILDDGRGLNAKKIRERAVEKGLIAQSDSLTDGELYQMIFHPGFSTAAKVSDVSGRGVGMDAVQTTVDALGGTVSVDTRSNQGTSITLRLPVSLAIVDGLRVRLGAHVCVLPLNSVEECVEIPKDGKSTRHGRRILDLRGAVLPLVPLSDLLGWAPRDENNHSDRVVIVRADGQRTGLVVDDVLGQSQTVVKPLSALHAQQAGLSGATILGDGAVAMILDVAGLLQISRENKQVAA